MTAEATGADTEAHSATGAHSHVAALVDSFVTLMRNFAKAKARMVAAAEHDVEWTAHLLLRQIAASGGPIRAAELAGTLHSDPPTVSRPGAALGKGGYPQGRAHPAGGRARPRGLPPRAADPLARR